MRKHRMLLSSLLLSVLIPLSAFQTFSCELTVRLEHYAPESQKNSSDAWSGVDKELTSTLLQQAQCRYSIVEIAWARSLIMLANGEVDLMINVSKTPERSRSFYFIGPIRDEVIVLATLAGAQFKLNEVSDITTLDKPIAIQRNAYYGEAIDSLLQQAEYQHHFIHVTDNKTKLKLLKRGRISGFLEAKRNIINSVNSDTDFDNVWFKPLVFHTNPIYFALSKKSISPEMKSKIEQSFEQIKTRGMIEAIDAKYHPTSSLPVNREN